MKFKIIASDGCIEAVLGSKDDFLRMGNCDCARVSIKAHAGAARLLPVGSVFDAELTERWGRLVACTREFSTWWRARPAAGAPAADFFLEVTV